MLKSFNLLNIVNEVEIGEALAGLENDEPEAGAVYFFLEGEGGGKDEGRFAEQT